MIRLRRSRKLESDSRYFNGYTDDTVPDVPYGPGGIPQYNPMVVDDRIELMDDVIKKLEDYWYSEDPKLEDEITRVTKREEVLYVKDIYWKLDNPDIVTVKFGVAGFDGSNERVADTREIDIDFEDFLGHDVEDNIVIFISSKINSLLDNVLHGGLYKENKTMRGLRRSRRFENRSFIKNESHGASTNLIKTCREFYPLIDQITDIVSNDLPSYDDLSYDEYKDLKNAFLYLREAIISVREAVEDLK